jgi:cytoskeletal protein CcmA (bactofilin family)
VLKSKAHVVGDIRHQSLTIEKGAYFEGRAAQAHGANGRQPDAPTTKVRGEAKGSVPLPNSATLAQAI